MKKIKLLTTLSSLTIVGATIAPLTSCALKLKTHIITIEAGEHGKVSVTSLKVDRNTTWGVAKEKITVTPDEGYHFKEWTKDGSSLEDSFVIKDNFTVKAIFEEDPITGYRVSTTGSSAGVTFIGLPKSVQVGESINATYTFDNAQMQLVESESDILVGTRSVKDWCSGWKEGKIKIHENLIDGDITIKICIKYKPWHLNQTWSQIINACSTYEASDQGDAAKATFVASFTASDKTITSIDDLAGCWTTILINNKEHVVRIVEASHDQINGGTKKAGLTFELVTLLSDNDGNSLTCQWDTAESFDYTNSILMKNLNGTGSATGEGVWTKCAIDMLPSDLKSEIKTVDKKIGTKTGDAATFILTDYTTKLFPFTYAEIGWTPHNASWLAEGSVYKYWDIERGSDPKIKKDFNGKAQYYWLATPQTDDTNYVGYISDLGSVGFTGVTSKRSVSFAFCI